MYVRVMQAGAAQAVEAVAALRAAYDAFAACDLTALTRTELLGVLDEYEALTCQMPTVLHRLLAQLQADTTPQEMGAKSWNTVLRIRWRLSTAEASRRLGEAAELGPRRALTGEPLPPVLPVVAAAEAAGLITADHVKVLRDAVSRLPSFVDTTTAEQFEADLVRVAVGVGPKELKDTAELRLFLLDQDGPEPDDTERARKRGATMGRQGRDGMTALTAHLDPETAAVWEVLFAKFAAPGMCNPADEQPCTSGTPSQTQIDNDHRSLAQRQHDALLVVGRIALMTDLGQLNGLPVSLIIRTTLQDLESRAGIGISGGGTKIPITDVIRMAGHAHWHLAVFDQATGSALNHFRARRVASPAQRIMLIARDGGCTKPGCTVGPYGCQAHHAVSDWADGGNTNIDEMALACGPDNRLVHTDGGYTTSINPDGDVEWRPPPHLEHSQNRINYHHRPELLLTPPKQPEPAQPESDRDWQPDWETDWDLEWDHPTPTPPNIEHLWDTEPLTPADLRLPPGWTLLDPHPPHPNADNHALSSKAVRGP
ncbi:HNH endonuclease signature motif containing protein [Mycolicibacterium lutetiense]|nr:HNH endonuclease signature motif containing protein [Mycolicibacterium lutetiense]